MERAKASVTRRSFMNKLAAGTSLVALGAFAPSAFSAEKTTLIISSFGGSYSEAQKKALFDPYVAANPTIDIRMDDPVSNAKLKAMVESGKVTWDIAVCADDFGLDEDAAWLEPIDYSVINADRFLPGYAQKYRLGADVEATVLAYRTDKHKAAPTSLADAFNADSFPGKRAFWKYASGGIFEAALIADGVDPKNLYPIDVDRALKRLDTIKDKIIWWESGAQSEQLLTSGEATIGFLWNGRASHAAEGNPIAISWEQWLTQNGFFVVPKGGRNIAAAMKALDAFTQPGPQIALSDLIPYGPTDKSGAAKGGTKYKGQLPTDHLPGRIVIDTKWWNANIAAVDAKFQEWLLS